jgi:hypothetical protein
MCGGLDTAEDHVTARDCGMGELYGQYHGRIIRLARAASEDGRWKSRLREILAEFDERCQRLSPSSSRLLCQELATQIEQEILQFSDTEKQAVLILSLKHFDAHSQ